MKFYKTKMGQNFFTQQIPQLAEALWEIAAALKQPAFENRIVDRLPDWSDSENRESDILSDIYDCKYMPESQIYGENDPLNEEVKKAMDAFLPTLSPEQTELFLQYEDAQNARGSSIAVRAYKDGIRLAVQIFMAGRPSNP